MITMQEMDPIVGISDQLSDSSAEPVVLVNVFHVSAEDVPSLLAAWKADAEYFKTQPGYISTQLHRGIAGSTTFLNRAVWESISQFRAAFSSPEFRERLSAYPDSATGSPHLFRRVAVDGLCIA